MSSDKPVPEKLTLFRQLVQSALTLTPDPSPRAVTRFLTQAHPEDASILASAALTHCPYLLTFNTRHYWPSADTPVTILTPGVFLRRLRLTISRLTE